MDISPNRPGGIERNYKCHVRTEQDVFFDLAVYLTIKFIEDDFLPPFGILFRL